jgi:hypothetical protein
MEKFPSGIQYKHPRIRNTAKKGRNLLRKKRISRGALTGKGYEVKYIWFERETLRHYLKKKKIIVRWFGLP